MIPTHAQAVFDYLRLQMNPVDQLSKTVSSLFFFNSCYSFSDFLPCASNPQANLLLTKKLDRYLSRCKSHKTPSFPRATTRNSNSNANRN